jgi:hypothetical protein
MRPWNWTWYTRAGPTTGSAPALAYRLRLRLGEGPRLALRTDAPQGPPLPLRSHAGRIDVRWPASVVQLLWRPGPGEAPEAALAEYEAAAGLCRRGCPWRRTAVATGAGLPPGHGAVSAPAGAGASRRTGRWAWS